VGTPAPGSAQAPWAPRAPLQHARRAGRGVAACRHAARAGVAPLAVARRSCARGVCADATLVCLCASPRAARTRRRQPASAQLRCVVPLVRVRAAPLLPAQMPRGGVGAPCDQTGERGQSLSGGIVVVNAADGEEWYHVTDLVGRRCHDAAKRLHKWDAERFCKGEEPFASARLQKIMVDDLFPRARSVRGRKVGVYTGRQRLGPEHPLVKKTEKALLLWIKRCQNSEFTIASTASNKTVYKDTFLGEFSPELLLPDFTRSVETAEKVLAKHIALMRKPIKSWVTVSRLNDDTGELDAEEGEEKTDDEEEEAEEEEAGGEEAGEAARAEEEGEAAAAAEEPQQQGGDASMAAAD
jgi:hypothetical protein